MGIEAPKDDSKCNIKLCQQVLLNKIEGLEKVTAAKFETTDAKFAAMDQATELNAEIITKRFESVNEFRGAMLDQTKNFATIKEVSMLFDKLDENRINQSEEIKDLQLSRAELSGKASQNQIIVAYIIAFLGIVSGLISIIITLAQNLRQ